MTYYLTTITQIFLVCILMVESQRIAQGRQFFRPNVPFNRRPLPPRRRNPPISRADTLIRGEVINAPFVVERQVLPERLNKRKLLLPIISEGYASTNFQGGHPSIKDEEKDIKKDNTFTIQEDSLILQENSQDLSLAGDQTTQTTTTVTTTTTTSTTTTTKKVSVIEKKKEEVELASPFFAKLEEDLIGVNVESPNIEFPLPVSVISTLPPLKTTIAPKKMEKESSGTYSVSIESVPAHDELSAPVVDLQATNVPKSVVQIVIPPEGGEIIEEPSAIEDSFYEPPNFNPDGEIYQAGYHTINDDTNIKIPKPQKEFHEDRSSFQINPVGPDYYPLGKPTGEKLSTTSRPEVPITTTTESSGFFSLFNFFGGGGSRPEQPSRKHFGNRRPPPRRPPPRGARPIVPPHERQHNLPPIRGGGLQKPLPMTSEPVIGLSRVPPGRKQSPFSGQEQIRPPVLVEEASEQGVITENENVHVSGNVNGQRIISRVPPPPPSLPPPHLRHRRPHFQRRPPPPPHSGPFRRPPPPPHHRNHQGRPSLPGVPPPPSGPSIRVPNEANIRLGHQPIEPKKVDDASGPTLAGTLSALLKRYLTVTSKDDTESNRPLPINGIGSQNSKNNAENGESPTIFNEESLSTTPVETQETTELTPPSSTSRHTAEISIHENFEPNSEHKDSDWFVLDPEHSTRRVILQKEDNSIERLGSEDYSLLEDFEVAKVTGALLRTFGAFSHSNDLPITNEKS